MRTAWAASVALAAVMLLGASACTAPGDAPRPEAAGNAAIAPTVEVVLTDLEIPWEIAFLPDGRMIFTERPGRVSLFDGKQKTEAARIEVATVGESGLLGLALDPQFKRSRFVYLYYSYHDGERLLNRVSRLTLEGDRLRSERVIFDSIPGAVFHDGGRIKFGPDGKLYVTVGDALDPPRAQDKRSLSGKILRINKDGTIPDDNPFGSAVWSYGHRNPQGLAFHPETGQLYEDEHGPNRMDEVNLIERGRNYGWPNYECNQRKGDPIADYVGPLACFDEYTLAPSGSVFYDANTLLIAGLRGSQLHRITFGADHRTVVKQERLFAEYGRLRTVAVHDGWVYFATNNRDGRGQVQAGDDKIIRARLPAAQ